MTTSLIIQYLPLLGIGFLKTAGLALAGIIGSTLVGFIYAVIHYYNVPVAKQIVVVLKEIFRGSPFLIQLLFVYFGLTSLVGTGVSIEGVCVVVISLYQGAYIAEVFRGGFESVGKGRLEAGRSLGLTGSQIFSSVIVPESWRVVLAPLFGQYVGLVKQTAIASVIGFIDLLFGANSVIQQGANPFAVLLIVALGFFILSYPLSVAALRLEGRTIAS